MADAYFDTTAELGSDEDDESYDGETGEPRQKTNGNVPDFEDSSEEEEDDDEDEAQKIKEGFIDDDDDNDDDPGGDDEEGSTNQRRVKKKHKRRREDRDDEELDAEDLDVIDPHNKDKPWKRIKRGAEEGAPSTSRDLTKIFDDDDDLVDDVDERQYGRNRDYGGEMDDFIEQDEFPEDDRELADIEVSRDPGRGHPGLENLAALGMGEAEKEDYEAVFGTGAEYDWALHLQENMDAEEFDPEKPIQLEDIFEPAQLVDKMLTDEDAVTRETDIPERLQLLRKPFPHEDLSADERNLELQEEAQWIKGLMMPTRSLDPHLEQPFLHSIRSVLGFLNRDNLEIPFIFQHKKDFLIHAVRQQGPGGTEDVKADKLLEPDDLWEILDHDLKFKAMVQKRRAIRRTFREVKKITEVQDDVENGLKNMWNLDEVQDIQEYVHFQYSAIIKDNNLRPDNGGNQKRAGNSTSLYERIRAAPAYNVVRGFGIKPDDFAQDLIEGGQSAFSEDSEYHPEDMADHNTDSEEFTTGQSVLHAAKNMFAEELVMNPKMRKYIRGAYYENGIVDCVRTEKGLKKITEDHPYYEFKYLRNQSIPALVRNPDLYLRIRKAEDDGLINVNLKIENEDRFRKKLHASFESDNLSSIADSWNVLRREVLNIAITRLQKMMVRSVKENLKSECETKLARYCRKEFYKKLDQCPYQPKTLDKGIEPRVLAMTNGAGQYLRDPVYWAWVEDGKVFENGTFTDIRLGNAEKGIPDGEDIPKLLELVKRRGPDVIGVSGYSVDTKNLKKDLEEIVRRFDLYKEADKDESDDDEPSNRRHPLDVIMVNDEVARLYHKSERANVDHPGLHPLTRYCIALGKYLQNPLKEYTGLGRDVLSITFHPDQHLIPQEKLLKYLDTAIVDIVNLVGVEINEVTKDSSVANLLQYVSGLGPRKAASMIAFLNRRGGQILTRFELIEDPAEQSRTKGLGYKVFENCASFLYIEYDVAEPVSNYVDNTRIHPVDYDIAKKMAADALDFDEEDVKLEVEEGGDFGVVRRLVQEGKTEKVNELYIQMYAEQLETSFHSRKRATLESIRAELQAPYEELRRSFIHLSSDEIFTMLTGETKDSLRDNMIYPVSIKRTAPDRIDVKMDCGLEGSVEESDFPPGVGPGEKEPRQAFRPHQTVQAKLIFLHRRHWTLRFSMRKDVMTLPYRKEVDRAPGEWDDKQEENDRREAEKRSEHRTGRAQRVVNHPLFHPFNTKQAEEFLGSQGRGDCVIRPSSKGADHLAVTWKVADNVFQHIDVLELNKENEFSVGSILKVAGKYTYSDLDELIVNHVKSMSKKVDEMTTDERFQTGSKAQTEQWLTAYMEANPRRSMYAFCINTDFPGYFHLIFKSAPASKHVTWPVKVVPHSFEMQKNQYRDMQSLKNGFKTLMQKGQQQRNGMRRPY
ncbi:MAG: Transcription elongation factor spt6 [Alyxoria varia]|nr:MAG: Transcription elongation factor spt6 [Alyxoria varia]